MPLFTLGDLEAIRRQAHDVALVTAAGSRVDARRRTAVEQPLVHVGGVMPEYFEIRGWGVVVGAPLSAEDERQGALRVRDRADRSSTTLFPAQSPLGKDLRVHDIDVPRRRRARVEGRGAFGADQDDVVFMPYSTFSRRIIGNDRVGRDHGVGRRRPTASTTRRRRSPQILRRRRHIAPGDDDDFAVRDPREIQALLQR